MTRPARMCCSSGKLMISRGFAFIAVATQQIRVPGFLVASLLSTQSKSAPTDPASLQRRRTVRHGAHPLRQGHAASIAHVVDDLKTLTDLSK
jgi:hypothetical protein